MPFYPKINNSGGGGGGGNTANPIWTKNTFSYVDFSDPSTTKTLNFTDPLNASAITGVIARIVFPFSGGSPTSVQLTLGTDLTSTAELTSGFEIDSANGAAADDTQSTNTVQEVGIAAPETVTITATAVGGNLSTLTGGSIEVWILLSTLPAASPP